jgi:hypothetical protein
MKKDWQILRELGKKVAEIAALPVQQETIALWKGLNDLKPVRPIVAIDLGIFDHTLRICWLLPPNRRQFTPDALCLEPYAGGYGC